jgi:general secretion pathway protein L
LRHLSGRALAWWLGELRGLYRDLAWRLTAGGGRNALTIEAGERYWTVRQGQRLVVQLDRFAGEDGVRGLMATIPRQYRRRPPIVEIPRERTLAKIISLPAAARTDLDRILDYEIARHFPFPAERVFFRHRIVARGDRTGAAGAATIEVELIAVARTTVAEICDELARAGWSPGRVAVIAGSDEERLYLPVAPEGGERAPVSRADRRLCLVAAVLAGAALLSLPLAQHRRLGAIESELARLKSPAEAVLDSSERQRRAEDRTAAVLRLAASRPALIAVLDELSRVVPDGSWLLSLGLSGRELVIDGLAPSAATTALALEKSPLFTGVVFRSSITRDPATGLEHFQLGAQLAERKP